MSATEVILIENIPSLGAEADVVKVKSGYARNYLIPTGKAYEVSTSNLRRLNQLKAKRAEREGRELNEAEDLAKKINKLKISMVLETGGTGKAFGSITAKDIADKLQEELTGVVIEKGMIELERPIKDIGPHEVSIKLHSSVTAKMNLSVKPKVEAAPKNVEDPEDEGEKTFKGKPKFKHRK